MSSSKRSSLLKPWHDPSAPAEENARARRAYEAVLTVTAASTVASSASSSEDGGGEDSGDFESAVKAISRERFGYEYAEDEEVNAFVANFHDAVRRNYGT